jgi:arylsulfatase A-like enzyme
MPRLTPAFALGATLALLSCGPSKTPANLVLVSLDTLRADRLSCMGYERPTTPTLDALAARGVRFADCWAASTRTAPSHMSLFSGLEPLAHGVWNVSAGAGARAALSPERPTLTEVLAQAGWRTGMLCDSGNVHPALGFGRGFELISAEPTALADKATGITEFLEARDGRPEFLFLHSYEPHAPYLPGPSDRGRFTQAGYSGEFRKRVAALAGAERGTAYAEAGRFLEPFEGLGSADVQFLSDLYDENVAHTDRQLGLLLAQLEQAAQGPTWWVVTSDHGEEFMEHGLLGHVGGLSRELLHVPLIVVGPEATAHVDSAPVGLVDLANTLEELLGLTPSLPGRSFAARVRGSGPESPGLLGQQLHLPGTGQAWYGLRRGRLHYVLFERLPVPGSAVGPGSAAGEAGGVQRGALFDLVQDPAGERDASQRLPQPTKELRARLVERRRALEQQFALHPPADLGAASQELDRQLESLGYLPAAGSAGGR